MARRNPLIKIAIGLVVLTALGFLFLQSVRNTGAEPYEIRREHVGSGTVVIEEKHDPDGALLALRPVQGLASSLYQQIFQRTMISVISPAIALLPLVLHSEFERAFQGVVSPQELATAARAAGLESVALTPSCLALRRLEGGREPPQLFYAIVELPQFTRFREDLGKLLAARGADPGVFDPTAISPVIFIAGSNRELHQWLPLEADAGECIAPVRVQ